MTINKTPDPTASPNIGFVHGRGIYLMKTLMDDVCFEEGGVVVYTRKSIQAATKGANRLAVLNPCREHL